MLFNEAADKFLNYIKVTKANGTYRFQQDKVSILKRYLGNYDSKLINNEVVLKFILDQRNRNPNIKNATLNMYISTLKRVLKYSLGITLDFEKLREQQAIIPTVSDKTIQKIFNYYRKHLKNKHNYRNYLFFKMLLDTGMRINEILHITINDLDIENNTIHLKITKTKTDRYVFFTDSTKSLLFKYLIQFRIKKYVFTDFNENKLSQEAILRMIKRLKKRLNITYSISPHKWRHTFATRFLKRCGNLESLRMILGHTDIKMTQRYLHLDKDFLRESYKNAFVTPVSEE